jgi:hypothetical protein
VSDDTGRREWVTAGLDAGALRALAETLAPSELWSLLLWVAEQRAARRTPAAVLEQWRTDRFVVPSPVDQRVLLEIDRELLAAAQSFESIELAPLAPLGSCSAVALTTQNRIVSSLRGTELVSDPTNLLALESARRLRVDPTLVVRLATSHRCVRAQSLPNRPGFAAHFRMFCLTSAGHEVEDQAFVVGALVEHVRTHLAALDRLEQCGYRFSDRSVKLLSTMEREPLVRRVADALPGVSVVHERLTHDYYDGLRFMVNARGMDGGTIPLIDGGAFDWLAKLMSNRKATFVASGFGSQLAAFLFRGNSRA